MNIQEWKTRVITYNEQLNEQLQKNIVAKDLYYGFEVIDGKIIENPEILFIGINPGVGNGKRHHTVKFDSERISYLDIYNDDYRVDYEKGYHLAEKVIKFFKLLNWSDEKIIDLLENKAVRTNFYHIATDDGKEINKTVNYIKSGFHHSYFKKSAEFTIQLIDIIKPKLVILEGKKVFDNIIVECCGENNLWKEDKFGDYFDKKLNTHFIGYDRKFSNENRAVFLNRLKNLLG